MRKINNSKFSIGQKVVCVEAAAKLKVGKTYTVKGFHPEYGFVIVDGVDREFGYFDHRFRAVEETEFNISTATDQALADEYRRVVNEVAPLLKELLDRGYSVTAPNEIPGKNVRVVVSTKRVIKKTETTEL